MCTPAACFCHINSAIHTYTVCTRARDMCQYFAKRRAHVCALAAIARLTVFKFSQSTTCVLILILDVLNFLRMSDVASLGVAEW